MLVSAGGYPLSYAVFNGSQYEGRTIIPIIDDFKQRFNLADFVVVADSGLMSKTNVKLLNDAGYRYIIGARIRNESGLSGTGYYPWTRLMVNCMNGPTTNVSDSL